MLWGKEKKKSPWTQRYRCHQQKSRHGSPGHLCDFPGGKAPLKLGTASLAKHIWTAPSLPRIGKIKPRAGWGDRQGECLANSGRLRLSPVLQFYGLSSENRIQVLSSEPPVPHSTRLQYREKNVLLKMLTLQMLSEIGTLCVMITTDCTKSKTAAQSKESCPSWWKWTG